MLPPETRHARCRSLLNSAEIKKSLKTSRSKSKKTHSDASPNFQSHSVQTLQREMAVISDNLRVIEQSCSTILDVVQPEPSLKKMPNTITALHNFKKRIEVLNNEFLNIILDLWKFYHK